MATGSVPSCPARTASHLNMSQMGGDGQGAWCDELLSDRRRFGTAAATLPRNGGQGGEQVVAVLVRLDQQEIAQDHRLQLLLLHY